VIVLTRYAYAQSIHGGRVDYPHWKAEQGGTVLAVNTDLSVLRALYPDAIVDRT
jgi:hypothetical protein